MALELMLSVLAHSAVLLESINYINMNYILLIISMECLCELKRARLRLSYTSMLTPKKVTEKVDAPKSVDAVAPALCSSISELRDRRSQCQMAPRFPRSPNISKCQVSDCH